MNTSVAGCVYLNDECLICGKTFPLKEEAWLQQAQVRK
jgi:hypothetical protein